MLETETDASAINCAFNPFLVKTDYTAKLVNITLRTIAVWSQATALLLFHCEPTVGTLHAASFAKCLSPVVIVADVRTILSKFFEYEPSVS